jgi:predicted  nucleic acid-binding Zn-ribbon protein
MMHNNLDDLSPEYEEELSQLETQISELFALLEKSDLQISLLKEENFRLKAQIQKLQQKSKPDQYKSPEVETIKVPKETIATVIPTDTSLRQNLRKCPNCGAQGFAIKEVDDKTRVICYAPRRIYMKKKVCTKCRFEF